MRSEEEAIINVCNSLRKMGETGLAERLNYLASDEDLEPGESSATPESACGFLEFYRSLESEGQVGLACSPEGWLCAEWRFPDKRGASLWFLDADRVMFSATGKNGEFIIIEGHGNIIGRSSLARTLAQKELFAWRSNIQKTETCNPGTT